MAQSRLRRRLHQQRVAACLVRASTPNNSSHNSNSNSRQQGSEAGFLEQAATLPPLQRAAYLVANPVPLRRAAGFRLVEATTLATQHPPPPVASLALRHSQHSNSNSHPHHCSRLGRLNLSNSNSNLISLCSRSNRNRNLMQARQHHRLLDLATFKKNASTTSLTTLANLSRSSTRIFPPRRSFEMS